MDIFVHHAVRLFVRYISCFRASFIPRDHLKPILIMSAAPPTEEEWRPLSVFPFVYYIIVRPSIKYFKILGQSVEEKRFDSRRFAFFCVGGHDEASDRQVPRKHRRTFCRQHRHVRFIHSYTYPAAWRRIKLISWFVIDTSLPNSVRPIPILLIFLVQSRGTISSL